MQGSGNNNERLSNKQKQIDRNSSNLNIKSSPYIGQLSLTSSFQVFVTNQKDKKDKIEKPKIQKNVQPLTFSSQRESFKQKKDDNKALKFNKGQMFLNLKQRQENYTQISK